jgi:hypothetical protein
VSYGSVPRLLVGKGYGDASRPTVPYGSHASSIKKGLAGVTMQLGSCVSKARAHVFKALDAKAIMGLQDVQAGGVINACKTCGQVTTI